MLVFRLKDILDKKHITITQMANDIGISRQAISSIANNSSTMIQLNTMQKISTYLNVPIDQLIVDKSEVYRFLISLPKKSAITSNNELHLSGSIKISSDSLSIESGFDFSIKPMLEGFALFDIEPIELGREDESRIVREIMPRLDEDSPEKHQDFINNLISKCIQIVKTSKQAESLDLIHYILVSPYLFPQWSFNFINTSCTMIGDANNVDASGIIPVNPISIPENYYTDTVIYSIN